jgi:hypothetical protein
LEAFEDEWAVPYPSMGVEEAVVTSHFGVAVEALI